MKVLLRIFIPLGILSFIAFGISIPILGTNGDWDDSYTVSDSMELTDPFNSIDIDVGAYDCTVKPYSGSTVKITVTGDTTHNIRAKISGDTLSVYHSGWKFGWLRGFDIFSWTSSIKVEVLVPEQQYESLTVYTGAGNAVIKDITAKQVDLGVGAGKLEYTQPDIVTDELRIDVSAGKLIAKNAATKNYSIDVSAGATEVYGLTGAGSIDVSAGSAKVYLAELNGDCGIDVSAGSVTFGIPEYSSATINCSKSAGSINLSAFGLNRNANDDEVVTFNGGKYNINADVSAGSIRITNANQESTGEITTATYAAASDCEETFIDTTYSTSEAA